MCHLLKRWLRSSLTACSLKCIHHIMFDAAQLSMLSAIWEAALASEVYFDLLVVHFSKKAAEQFYEDRAGIDDVVLIHEWSRDKETGKHTNGFIASFVHIIVSSQMCWPCSNSPLSVMQVLILKITEDEVLCCHDHSHSESRTCLTGDNHVLQKIKVLSSSFLALSSFGSSCISLWWLKVRIRDIIVDTLSGKFLKRFYPSVNESNVPCRFDLPLDL